MGVLSSKIERVLSKEIQREQLEPGDHIYTWRPDNSKSHGIYVVYGDDEKVIHFTPRVAGQEYTQSCVELSPSIDDFLDGGKLYRFEYGVNRALFLVKPQGYGTLKSTATPEVVKNRASFLLEKGFRVHHRFKNNSLDFAVYCKTGLLSIRLSRSEQAASLLGCAAIFLLFPLHFLITFTPASLTHWVATCVVFYCTCKLAFDMGANQVDYGEYAVERYAQEEVRELGFLLTLACQILLVFIIWLCLGLAVVNLIYIFIKKIIILIFGDGCCLARSETRSTHGGAIATPITSREPHVCVKMAGVLWSKIERVLSKKIQREQLKPGDHIYTWKPDNSKVHGIYVGDGVVIHLAGQEYGVRHINIDNFVDGGELYLFEYGVNLVLFLTKPQVGATCTLFTDTPECVNNRASFFLDNGFLVPHLFKNNSEGFAVFCKTGLLSIRIIWSEAAHYWGITVAVLILLNSYIPVSLTGWAAIGVVVYCTCRLATDIGARPNVSINEIDFGRLAQVEVSKFEILPGLKAYMASIVLVFSIWLYLVFHIPECVMVFCWAIFQRNFNFRNWPVLFNKIRVDQVQRGDHIYTWRGYSYTHHGIYVGNGKVIHAVRGPRPFIHSLAPFYSSDKNVESINIDEFLRGGELYRYQYGVTHGYFLAKIHGGACTLASSDPPKDVLYRARFLFYHNRTVTLGAYDLLRNNCEDFALYCKTGLAVKGILPMGGSGQIVCLFAVIYFNIPYLKNLIRLAAGFCSFSASRVFFDTKYRQDTRRIPVEQSTYFDLMGVISMQLLLFVPFLSTALWSWWCSSICVFGMCWRWAITECHVHKKLNEIFL